MFAETLKDLRKQYGMTQRELAAVLGVTLRTVQNYEAGKQVPKNEAVLSRISSYFGIPVRSLVSSDDFYRILRTEARQELTKDERTELYQILHKLTALFAGGSLSRSDKELFLEAIRELLTESEEEELPEEYRG